jgi:hypothetical protein
MQLTNALLAGLSAGLVGVITSWLVTGVIFHPYQRRTPGTWRSKEGPREYALASGATVLAALIIALFFALTGGVPTLAGSSWVANGAAFGALCWAALGMPVLLSMGLFVNMHPGVVIGLLLDWFLVSVLAGLVTAWAVSR